MKLLNLEVVILAAIITLPLILQNNFVTSIAVVAVIYSILSLSWYFMEREAGWVSLSHSIPFGITAYALAINPPLVIPAFLSSLILFLILSIFGKEKFIFSSFITAFVVWYLVHYLVLRINGGVYGGEEGFSFLSIGLWNSYFLSSMILVASLVLFSIIRKTSFGLKIEAVRDDEVAARSIGINTFMIRTAGFAISITLAGIAGFCYLLYFGHVSPEIFSAEVALLPFIASLIAGKRLISPVLGSYAIVIVSRAFSGIIPEAHLLMYAAVLILSPILSRWWNAEAG